MSHRSLIITAVTLVVLGLGSMGGVLAFFYYFHIGPFARTEMATTEGLADAGHYETENNWIAATTAQEITGMCWLATRSSGAVPSFTVQAEVDPQKRSVHLAIGGWQANKTMTVDLTPAYAWDPSGYAAMAEQLLAGEKSNEPATADTSDILTDLLNPTGKILATTDVALSKALLQAPASATVHEKAALLLTTLALRENAWVLTDTRRLLCRATAHLAVAQALRGTEPPGWAGRVANAALLTLSGREVDALGQLNTLSAAPDATYADKVWLRALRLANKDDWRMETPGATSPLLLKIIWFQTVANNFEDSPAAARLDHVGPLEQVPDWGRALLASNRWTSVEIGHRFCESTLGLELRELSDVMVAENKPIIPGTPLSRVFDDPIGTTISASPDGSNSATIVGSALFKDISWRQLFLAADRTHFWLRDSWGVPEEDAKFMQEMTSLFHGVSHEKYLSLLLHNKNPNTDPAAGDLQDDVASIPPGFAFFLTWPAPAENRLCSYFVWGIPFDAPYSMNSRCTLVASNRTDYGKPTAPSSTPPTFSDLQALAPDSYLIASWIILTKLNHGGHMSKDEEEALLSPFFDYDGYALTYFKTLSEKQSDFDDATLELILRKQCALNPDEYFSLGDFLQAHGRIDEAAEAYRNGVKLAQDQVLVSDSVQPLVEYDYAHGLQDEALQIAQNAANVYSYQGIDTYAWLLCKLNRFDEAEDWEKKNQERYGGNALVSFYASQRDHFSDQYKAAETMLFPGGLPEVTLASFTAPPKNGVEITGSSVIMTAAGLRQGDIIVALDSHPVSDTETYAFVRALSTNPVLDLIVWRDGKYLELKPSLLQRKFHADIGNYSPR